MPRLDSTGARRLLDTLLQRYKLKNDAELARRLELAPPVLSKLRHGRLPVGPALILRIYDAFDMDVKESRALASNAVLAEDPVSA
ncbi:hypothetical protein HSX11_01595 [Oxalobacteraceae bacterium]|nr:hypothetical protein [Oxalobacteraceae bacterium]